MQLLGVCSLLYLHYLKDILKQWVLMLWPLRCQWLMDPSAAHVHRLFHVINMEKIVATPISNSWGTVQWRPFPAPIYSVANCKLAIDNLDKVSIYICSTPMEGPDTALATDQASLAVHWAPSQEEALRKELDRQTTVLDLWLRVYTHVTWHSTWYHNSTIYV